MDDVKKSLFYRLLLGFGAGILIGGAFLFISRATEYPMDDTGAWEIVKTLFFCGLYGSAGLCAMILYKIDSLSLVIATAVHFFVVMAGLFLLGLALDWDFDSAMAISIFSAYVLIFIFVWSITYFIGKGRVREMNMNLQLWKLFQAEPRYTEK